MTGFLVLFVDLLCRVLWLFVPEMYDYLSG